MVLCVGASKEDHFEMTAYGKMGATKYGAPGGAINTPGAVTESGSSRCILSLPEEGAQRARGLSVPASTAGRSSLSKHPSSKKVTDDSVTLRAIGLLRPVVSAVSAGTPHGRVGTIFVGPATTKLSRSSGLNGTLSSAAPCSSAKAAVCNVALSVTTTPSFAPVAENVKLGQMPRTARRSKMPFSRRTGAIAACVVARPSRFSSRWITSTAAGERSGENRAESYIAISSRPESARTFACSATTAIEADGLTAAPVRTKPREHRSDFRVLGARHLDILVGTRAEAYALTSTRLACPL